MNKQIRTLGLLVFVVIGLMAFSGSALAAGPPPDDLVGVEELIRNLEDSADPYAEYSQLSPEERAAVDRYLKVASIEREDTSPSTLATSASSGCGTNSYSVRGENIWGQTLWKFSTQTQWCWNGTEITNDPHFTTDGDVYAPFWSYEGTTYERATGGQGDWVHIDSAEGEFKLCFGPWGIGCVQHQYPDIHKRQYGDGQSQAWGS